MSSIHTATIGYVYSHYPKEERKPFFVYGRKFRVDGYSWIKEQFVVVELDENDLDILQDPLLMFDTEVMITIP